jgi:hypothetical protein
MFANIYTGTLGEMRGILNVLDGAAITTSRACGRNEQGHGGGTIVRHAYVPI